MFLVDYKPSLQRELDRKDGYQDGYSKGTERINELNRKLLADNRITDFEKSLHNADYQNELLKEYHL